LGVQCYNFLINVTKHEKRNTKNAYLCRMAAESKILLTQERLAITLERLCHQLLEDWGDFSNACLIGIQPRGVPLANRLHQRLQELTGNDHIEYGRLDITFYRDDFRKHDKPLSPYPNEIDFIVTDKRVLLIDDVLYTGRTIQAALSALQHYGRPKKVDLLVLVDRHFNRHLPIRPDYKGIRVDAVDEAYVRVRWEEIHGTEQVLLFDRKE
jgi:pyrimidine operon attenuation protein / uracil phosphoribosyltransferase